MLAVGAWLPEEHEQAKMRASTSALTLRQARLFLDIDDPRSDVETPTLPRDPCGNLGPAGRSFVAELPGVVLRRRLVRRPDLVEPGECLVVEVHVERRDCVIELLERAGPDDRPGDAGTRQQPSETDAGRLLTDLVAEVLVSLYLIAV